MKHLLVLFVLVFTIQLNAQRQVTKNILTFEKELVYPKSKIGDVAWISGNWKGEALGGVVEENWSQPSGDSMMAAFKLLHNGKVSFYEIEIIREYKGSLILQLKHFNGDLKGWEAKDDTVDFPLVKLQENIVYFDGMTFERVSENEMNVYVLMKKKDGTANELKFNYKK